MYYDGRLPRAPDSGLGFQEITQAGLECLGTVNLCPGRGADAGGAGLMEVWTSGCWTSRARAYLCALVDELGLHD